MAFQAVRFHAGLPVEAATALTALQGGTSSGSVRLGMVWATLLQTAPTMIGGIVGAGVLSFMVIRSKAAGTEITLSEKPGQTGQGVVMTILVENAQEFIALPEVCAVVGVVGVHENYGVIVPRGCEGEAEEFVVPARSERHVGLQMQVAGCLQLNFATPLEGSPLGVPVHTSFGCHNNSGATQFFLGPGIGMTHFLRPFNVLAGLCPGRRTLRLGLPLLGPPRT